MVSFEGAPFGNVGSKGSFNALLMFVHSNLRGANEMMRTFARCEASTSADTCS